MSDLNPYLISLYIAATTKLDLPNEYLRKQEITPALVSRIYEIASNYGISDLIDADEISDALFVELSKNGVFEIDEPKFAGRYYKYSDAHYTALRVNYRQNDGITVTSGRIGSRFFPDVFDGFRALANASTENALEIPASDRIVRLDDNQPEIADIRAKTDEFIEAFKGNDFGDLTPEEVEVANSEAQDLKTILSKPVVRSAVIADYSVRTLRWVAEKAAGAAIGKVAWGLLLMIAAFFGFTI